MKIRVLAFTAIGAAVLICAPAIAQSPPPPGPAATMQPVANPPEAPKTTHPKAKHHAKHHAKAAAKTEAPAPAAAAAPSK